MLFAVTLAGVWVTVPDTEEALVLLGALTIPTLVAFIPTGAARPIGAHALSGLMIWVVAGVGEDEKAPLLAPSPGSGCWWQLRSRRWRQGENR